jgi:hypothetical protein
MTRVPFGGSVVVVVGGTVVVGAGIVVVVVGGSVVVVCSAETPDVVAGGVSADAHQEKESMPTSMPPASTTRVLRDRLSNLQKVVGRR